MPEKIKISFDEVGKKESESTLAMIRAAIKADFSYPTCYDEFDRIRRTQPEVAMVRALYTSTARDVSLHYELPENATPDDEEFTEFLNSVLEDIDIESFKEVLVTQVPFMGWGFWEIVPGLRQVGWVAPDGREWESFNDDGLIGIRKLSWRDQSTLLKWVRDEFGEIVALRQQVYPDEPVDLPLNRALHLTFGDSNSPTGLSPLQAVTRLKRIKHALEVVLGMGFEHAAGYVKFTVKSNLDAKAKTKLSESAKAIMTATQGSYITDIEKMFESELIDVSFSAASDLLEVIRYYGVSILQIFATHFIAVATSAGTGSYSATSDHSQIFLNSFNAIMQGFAEQAGRQLASFIKQINGDRFTKITAYPTLQASEVHKVVGLAELGSFLEAFSRVLPLSEEDARAIRERSEILPVNQPEQDEDIAKASAPAVGGFETVRRGTAFEKVKPTGSAVITAGPENAFIDDEDIDRVVEIWNAFCDEYYPEYSGMLEARVIDENETE